MNFLSLLFGVSTVEELKAEFADELAGNGIDGLVGVADETYPAKKGAKKDLYGENMRRKQDGDQPKKWPEGFSVGSSYLPQLSVSWDGLLAHRRSRRLQRHFAG